MAIQAQLYQSNAFSSFANNGSCAGALIDSHCNSQHKHHHHHQQQQSQQHLREWQGHVDPNLHFYDSKALNLSSFPIQLEKQFEEIDQYIRFQNEKLRYILQEHGKQQAAALVKRLESRSLHVLREKDEEIAKVEKKRVELEECLRNLEAENRKWQRVAQEKETMALTLYKTLDEMREGDYCSNNNGVVADDAVSFCDETRGNEEDEEEATAENRGGGAMLCKSCISGKACFLFLPCRHLCCCTVCNAFLEACPVCRMPKKASIETLIF